MNCLRSWRRVLISCKAAGPVRTLPPQTTLSTRYYCSRFAALERLNILGSIRTYFLSRSPVPPLHHRRHCSSDHGRWYHKPCKVAAAAAALASGATAVAVCSRYEREMVPYTNRTHLVFISPQSEIDFFEPLFIEDKKLWASKSQIVDPLHPDSVRLRLIADRVLRAAYRTLDDTRVVIEGQKGVKTQTRHLDGLKWEVILIKDGVPNAECSPAGKIVVYTGLLDHYKTDAEIAFVLAHEIGHIVARHKADVAYTKWFPLFLFVPSYRMMEIEAHHIGMLLLGAAGFHPNIALQTLWKKAKIEGASTVLESFVSPYPSYKKTMERLSQPQVMEKAMKLYRESTPDQGTVRQAADKGFCFRETLADICNIISTRLKQVLRGSSTNLNTSSVNRQRPDLEHAPGMNVRTGRQHPIWSRFV